MNADRLLAHYEKISDAPDAIPRLRRFILDLAVRGKLVEQDPNDEPASELLTRIAKEKAKRLVKTKRIKKSEVNPINEEVGCPLTFLSFGGGRAWERLAIGVRVQRPLVEILIYMVVDLLG